MLGLALGTVYATGFATSGGTTGSTSNAPLIFSNPGNSQDTDGLNALITSSGNLDWSFNGLWGSVASQVMYTVNVTGETASNNYYIGVYLTNSPVGFSDLQLQLRIAVDGPDDTCTTSDLTSTATSNYRVFVLDANDAQVTFSGMGGATTGLPGSERYCIGIVNYIGAGQDPSGTFIRRATASTTPTYPTFVATLNRMT